MSQEQQPNAAVDIKDGRKLGIYITEDAIWEPGGPSFEAKGLYTYFCRRAGKGGKSSITLKRICSDLGISRKYLQNLVTELEAWHLLKSRQRKRNHKFSSKEWTVLTARDKW